MAVGAFLNLVTNSAIIMSGTCFSYKKGGSGRQLQLVKMYMRLIYFLFTVFGLLVALPIVIWQITSTHLFAPLAILLTFLSIFAPIAVIAFLNLEDDPDDAEVPVRIRDDDVVHASKLAGTLIGAGVVLWLLIW